MTAISKRPWYQFSVTAMFVVTVVVSIPLAWVGYSLNWIRQREQARYELIAYWQFDGAEEVPLGLRLFGERGATTIACPKRHMAEVQRLFPEATVIAHEFSHK
jgi:hypothetical protein